MRVFFHSDFVHFSLRWFLLCSHSYLHIFYFYFLPAHILAWATIFEFTSCSEAITYVIHSVYHYNDWELKSKEIDSSFHKFSFCAKRVRAIVPTCTTLSISWKSSKRSSISVLPVKNSVLFIKIIVILQIFNKSNRKHCFSRAQKEKNGMLTLVLSHIVPAEFVMKKNSKMFTIIILIPRNIS